MVFVIDSHYLLTEEAVTGALETAVRHSRHHDLSLHFVTQTGGEFAESSSSRTIAELCSVVQLHRLGDSGGAVADWCGLNDREIDWVRTAQAGDAELGYSEALLCVDGEGTYPVRVRASEEESEWIGAPNNRD